MPSPETKERTCQDCKYCFSQDTGYSNYTVEGTEFTCLNGSHPAGSFDEFYGETPELKYAKECLSFTPGNRIEIDVDEENWSDVTPEQIELLKRYRLVRMITGGREIEIPQHILA